MFHKTKTFMGKDKVFSVTRTGSMNSLHQWWWCWGWWWIKRQRQWWWWEES